MARPARRRMSEETRLLILTAAITVGFTVVIVAIGAGVFDPLVARP